MAPEIRERLSRILLALNPGYLGLVEP